MLMTSLELFGVVELRLRSSSRACATVQGYKASAFAVPHQSPVGAEYVICVAAFIRCCIFADYCVIPDMVCATALANCARRSPACDPIHARRTNFSQARQQNANGNKRSLRTVDDHDDMHVIL